jgi:hypothetical protein
MDKKILQKMIIMFFVVFILGFGLLIIYYINYSGKAEDRKNDAINNLIEQEKTLDQLIKDNSSNLKPTKQTDKETTTKEETGYLDDYKEYVNEQLNVSSSKPKEEIENIYNQAIQKIRIASIGFNFDEAADLANKALSENVFEDGVKYGTLSSISFIYGLNEMSPEEKYITVGTIQDPVVYMAAFYSMTPEYQVELLANEEFIYIPINEANQPSLISVEKGGAAESRASEYFSNLTECDIAKIKIEVAGMPYYVYVTGKEGYSYKITNIELGDKTIDARTTYSDHFEMWGREEVIINLF